MSLLWTTKSNAFAKSREMTLTALQERRAEFGFEPLLRLSRTASEQHHHVGFETSRGINAVQAADVAGEAPKENQSNAT
jgi:hypothetical protein